MVDSILWPPVPALALGEDAAGAGCVHSLSSRARELLQMFSRRLPYISQVLQSRPEQFLSRHQALSWCLACVLVTRKQTPFQHQMRRF